MRSLLIILASTIVGWAQLIPTFRLPNSDALPWRHTGVPGGIPSRTIIFTNMTSLDATGTSDSSAALQNALNNCPSNQVVQLPNGTFKLDATLELITGTTLRGSGPTNTTLLINHASTAAVNCGIDLNLDAWTTHTISSGATKGSTNVVLDSANLFSIGQLILLDELNDTNFVVISGSSALFGRANGARAVAHLARVQNISGTTVTFWPPLHWNYTNSFAPQASQWTDYPFTRQFAGIEDLRINNSGGAAYATQFQLSYACWMKNVETTNGVSIEAYITKSSCIEIRDSYFHDPSLHTVNRGYGVELASQTSNCRVENNIFNYMAFPLSSMWGAHGCAIGYNYCTNANSGTTSIIQEIMGNHGPHPMMNLWEGNVLAHISSDILQGGNASYITFFRNWALGWIAPPVLSVASWNTDHGICVEIMATNLFHNLVGNVLGVNGHTPTVYQYDNVTANASFANSAIYQLGYTSYGANSTTYPVADLQLYRHGNFDYSTETTIWDGSNTNHTLPASLYLSAQPAWWNVSTPFPPLGPDLTIKTNKIPAQLRFESGSVAPPLPPPTPSSLPGKGRTKHRARLF